MRTSAWHSRWRLAALVLAAAGLSVALLGLPGGDRASAPGQPGSERSAEVLARAAAAIDEYEQVRRNAARLVTVVAAPLRRFGCMALLLDDEAAQAAFETAFPLAAAHLVLEGRCFERRPRRARALIDKTLAQAPMDSEALALLGRLYERGWAVEKDEGMARLYYKRAALAAGGRALWPDESALDPATRRLADFWGVSSRDMWLRFINPVTGPWDLPQSLRKEVEWVADVERRGGDAVMAVAVHLRDGSSGMPKDDLLAFEWMRLAAVGFRHPPAFFPFAEWIRDRELLDKRRKAGPVIRDAELTIANYLLLDAAWNGDRRALPVIFALLMKAPDFPKRNWSIYYWARRLERDGHNVPEDIITRAAQSLSMEDRKLLDQWDDFATGPPHTELAKIEWPPSN